MVRQNNLSSRMSWNLVYLVHKVLCFSETHFLENLPDANQTQQTPSHLDKLLEVVFLDESVFKQNSELN